MRKIFAFFFILGLLHSTYSQIQQDKVLHFLGGNLYGLVGAGVASQISDGDRTWTFIGAIGGSLLIGLAKESIDQKQYGGWDNADLLATVLGGATVGVTIDIAVGYSELEIKKTFLVENAEISSLSLLGMSKTVMEK